MAAPEIESIYPSDSSTGIPVGIDILITFDTEIDPVRAKQNILIVGPDFDTTSGPDSVQWLDPTGARNPFFLQSPGYTGDLKFAIYFESLNSDDTVFSGSDYGSGAPNYKTRVKIKPAKPLAPNTEYTVYVIGNPDPTDGVQRGISTRTIYSVQLGANTGTGEVFFRGGYTGTVGDQIVVEITEAGTQGTCEYSWWFASAPTLVYEGRASRKYRSLIDTGVDIRFTGEDFAVGDTFSINVYPPTYMAASYTFSFTTGTGSIESLPSTTSTSVLGTPTTSPTSTGTFEVSETTPSHRELKVSANQRVIKVVFSSDVDPTTITDRSVRVEAHPATDVGRLNKFILVQGDTIYILLQTGEA
jgi:hypothetical protein